MRKISFTYAGTPEQPGAAGPTVYGDCYLPDEDCTVRGIVQFVHGMDEHFGRYSLLAEALAANGYVLCGEDHRGHGRSMTTVFGSFSASGDGWRLVLSDLFRLRARLKTRFPGIPYILLGHSMGSFLVRSMLLADSAETPLADAVILTGTAYHEAALLELGQAYCRSVIAVHGRETPMDSLMELSSVLYNLRIPKHETARDWVCSAPDILETLKTDPYCGHSPTAGLFDDMLGGLLAVCAGAALTRRRYTMPVLLLSGKNDPVGDYGAGVRKTAALLKPCCPSVETKLSPGIRHEVLLDVSRELVYRDILTFLDTHIGNR